MARVTCRRPAFCNCLVGMPIQIDIMVYMWVSQGLEQSAYAKSEDMGDKAGSNKRSPAHYRLCKLLTADLLLTATIAGMASLFCCTPAQGCSFRLSSICGVALNSPC